MSLKELQHDPFLDFAHTRLGAALTGTVQKVAPLGIFLEVEKDIVGLLPAAELQDDPNSATLGETYPVVVSTINLNQRRVILALTE
ncbi:S1 RNA-binding domain-containing protein [Streptomyces sp. NBC_01186]|uniref:S1 RNA-binding domain-containing protein n=1 Tax=Streptomyces sp. NBC_01186 TaxID=2903765 RepID=UPI003FA75BD7